MKKIYTCGIFRKGRKCGFPQICGRVESLKENRQVETELPKMRERDRQAARHANREIDKLREREERVRRKGGIQDEEERFVDKDSKN